MGLRRALGDLGRMVEDNTPEGRERFLDLLRVAAILMVIVGHWIVRVVTAPAGQPEAGYLLNIAPQWQWATLLWQVMPLFFLVGAVLNVRSLRRARARSDTALGWVRARSHRLLRPTGAFLVLFVPLWVLAERLVTGGAIAGTLYLDMGVALIPLWFVAAYMVVTALTPLTLALHDRGWSWPAVALAVGLAAALDGVRFAGIGPVVGTQPLVAGPNFLLIWGAVYLLGHLWADGRLPQRPLGQAALAGTGALALALLIGPGGWPLSMVPLEGTAAPNNAAPPTVALFALALVQLGVALLLRGPLERALRRPALWTPVALLGGRMMTLFLWHQAVMVVMTNLLIALGWPPLTEAVDARWWAQQPLWVLAFAVPLALLIPLVGRFEAPARQPSTRGPGTWRATIAGITLAAGAIGLLLWLGFTGAAPGAILAAVALFWAGHLLVQRPA